MTIKKEDIKIKNLDHLGIVAGIINDLGIVEKINNHYIYMGNIKPIMPKKKEE